MTDSRTIDTGSLFEEMSIEKFIYLVLVALVQELIGSQFPGEGAGILLRVGVAGSQPRVEVADNQLQVVVADNQL